MVVAAPIMALVSATIGAIAAAHTEQTKKLSMTENQKRPPLISKWTTGLSD
jgi:hypothetical protein